MIKLDFNLLINMVNIIILCLLLKKFLIKPVMKIMQDRETLINNDLENAKDKQAEADIIKQEYQDKLANATDEARDIITKSKAEASFHYEKIVDEAKEEAVRIINDAQQTAKFEEERAMNDIKKTAATLAVDIAKKVTMATSSETISSAAYDKFIKEAGEMDDRE